LKRRNGGQSSCDLTASTAHAIIYRDPITASRDRQEQQMSNHSDDLTLDDEAIVVDDDTETEADALDIDPEKRRIFARPSDPTVKDLFDRYKDGDLLLQPDFQRYFVWDRSKQSRLVESVILDVPLPIIYLAEEPDGKEAVIDGQQRLMTFFRFIDGELALSGLQVRKDLEGKRYADLDKVLQNTIRRAAIRTITIQKESDKDLKFEIFYRINTGSVALNPQELRNCVFRGPYNEVIRDLASDADFRFLLGISSPDKRMKDRELVLRFAAFHHATYLKYRPPMRRFLNADMEQYRGITKQQADELSRAFRVSVQSVRSLLGKNAFRRFTRGQQNDPNGGWESRSFNSALYDILMAGFTRYDKNQVYTHLDSIREALIWLMTEDEEFVDCIQTGTSEVRKVQARFEKWYSTLRLIVGAPRTEPRCFSQKLKEQLFEGDPTCAICRQRIGDIDDGAIDHIEQYWLGGKTIPQNARLTHRYCNWSRTRRDGAEATA
jgi:hypothetical protein